MVTEPFDDRGTPAAAPAPGEGRATTSLSDLAAPADRRFRTDNTPAQAIHALSAHQWPGFVEGQVGLTLRAKSVLIELSFNRIPSFAELTRLKRTIRRVARCKFQMSPSLDARYVDAGRKVRSILGDHQAFVISFAERHQKLVITVPHNTTISRRTRLDLKDGLGLKVEIESLPAGEKRSWFHERGAIRGLLPREDKWDLSPENGHLVASYAGKRLRKGYLSLVSGWLEALTRRPIVIERRFDLSSFKLELKRTIPDGVSFVRASLHQTAPSLGEVNIVKLVCEVPPEKDEEVQHWAKQLGKDFDVVTMLTNVQLRNQARLELSKLADPDGLVRDAAAVRERIERMRHASERVHSRDNDFRHPAELKKLELGLVSLDGEIIDDPEDLVYGKITGRREGEIYIAIADASWRVHPGVPEWDFAQAMGSTYYYRSEGGTKTISYVDKDTTLDQITFQQGEWRPAWVIKVKLRWDSRMWGKIVDYDFDRMLVRNAAQLTSQDVHAALQGGDSPHAENLKALRTMASALSRIRFQQSVFPRLSAGNSSDRIVQAAMVAAYHLIADWCRKNEIDIIYRVQASPGMSTLRAFVRRVTEAGIPASIEDFTDARRFNAIINALEAKEQYDLVRDIFKVHEDSAYSSLDKNGHGRLGLECYMAGKWRKLEGLINQNIIHRAMSDLPPFSRRELEAMVMNARLKDDQREAKIADLALHAEALDGLALGNEEFAAEVLEQTDSGVRVYVHGFDQMGYISSSSFGFSEGKQRLLVRYDGYDPLSGRHHFLPADPRV